jgi:hypothetical protein
MRAAHSPLPDRLFARRAIRWIAAGLLVLVAIALARPAEAARLFAPAFFKPKEFDIVRDGNTFHIFYIRQDLRLVTDSTTIDFGHAISSDLHFWVEQEPVLKVRRDKWDSHHVWAPSVVKQNGLWYMFYTGVANTQGQYIYHQRTGVAVSADLWNWQRFDAPLYTCNNVPWAYCDPLTFTGGDFRDPCVIPEPGQPGNWLMYYAGRPASSPGQMLIGVARSTGNLMQWTDVKPLWNTGTARTFSPLVESPELVERNGLWYLFYTTNSGHSLSYQTTSDPLADSTGWTSQFRLFHELPEESTDQWFGIEFFRDQGHDYLLAVNGGLRCIEIREVVWDDPPHFHVIEPTAYNITLGVGDAAPPPLGIERIADGGAHHTRFRITLPAAVHARVDVVDVMGRQLRTVIDAPLLAGPTEITWDGVDRDGRRARSGVYFARLRTADDTRAVRFIRLR